MDLVRDGPVRPDVESLAPKRPRLRKALGDCVADDDTCGTEELARSGTCQTDRAGASDVDDGAGAHLSHHRAVEARREDVREQRQVGNLLHRLRAIWELEQIEVRIRDHHVLGLAAHPAAHVDVAVGRARARRVDVQAHTRVPALARRAAAARDVEWN